MKAAKQPAGKPSELDPVYTLRDELAYHFNPVTAFERLLCGAAAQAWQRFEDAQEIERRLFEQTGPLELLDQQPGKFKEVIRYVSRCERAWHKALDEIRTAIRQRQSTLASPNARRGADRLPPAPDIITPELQPQSASHIPARVRRE
jgi:hypothetical protein